MTPTIPAAIAQTSAIDFLLFDWTLDQSDDKKDVPAFIDTIDIICAAERRTGN